MKISRSFLALARIAAVALLLLSVKTIATHCDEDCSAEAPVCECVCACCSRDMVDSSIDFLPSAGAAQYAVHFDSPQSFLFLATDIFRPPIA